MHILEQMDAGSARPRDGASVSNHSSIFLCAPCHQAVFTLTGAVVSGPTRALLDHYPLCLSAAGTIGIDTNTVELDPAQRYRY